jgi:hypothetical protein
MTYKLIFQTETETVSTSHPNLPDAFDAAGAIFGDVVFNGKPDCVLVSNEKGSVAIIVEQNVKGSH